MRPLKERSKPKMSGKGKKLKDKHQRRDLEWRGDSKRVCVCVFYWKLRKLWLV